LDLGNERRQSFEPFADFRVLQFQDNFGIREVKGLRPDSGLDPLGDGIQLQGPRENLIGAADEPDEGLLEIRTAAANRRERSSLERTQFLS
jgi:hypothetical protein